MDAHIKFAMLTGVTKFGKVSVFSDLNHLRDISMVSDFYDICGLTETELSENFKDYFASLANACKVTPAECLTTMRQRYDGYHFQQDTSTPSMATLSTRFL